MKNDGMMFYLIGIAIATIAIVIAILCSGCGGAGSTSTEQRPSILEEPLPTNCQTFLRLAAACIDENDPADQPALRTELQKTVSYWLDFREKGWTNAELDSGCGYDLEASAYQWFCPGMHQ